MIKKSRFLLIVTLLVSACFATAALWALPEEAGLFEEAERRYRKGDYQFALSRYEKLIREYPGSEYTADAHFRKGVILFRLGKTEEAAAYLQRVRSRYSYTRFAPYIPFWQGAAAYRLGEYEGAIGYFDSYLADGNGRYREDALLYLALSKRKLGRQEEALGDVRRIAEEPSQLADMPEAFRLFAALLVETGRHEELLSAYGDVSTEDFPEQLHDPLRLYRAEALLATGRRTEAEEAYTRLLDAPAAVSGVAYQRLFNLYLEEGREEESREILDRAQSALSGYPSLLNEFFMRVGIESYTGGDTELAEAYLRRVWRSVPADELDPLVPLYLSYAVEENESPGTALSLLEQYFSGTEGGRQTGGSGAAADEEVREALLFAAVRYSSLTENWSGVEKYAGRYLDTYPDTERTPRATYLYAFALYRTDQSRAALRVLSDLARKREEGGFYDDITLLLARVHMELGRWSEADEVLREYLPLHPEEPKVYADLIRVSFSMKNWEQAVHWSKTLEERVENLETAHPDIYFETAYLRGLSYLGMKQYRSGAERLEALMEGGYLEDGEGSMGPHLLFFAGWARYKLAEYGRSISHFSSLVDRYPDHSRTPEGRYLLGWASFADERYTRAEEAFAEYARFAGERSDRMRGLYMYAKSLSLGGNTREALSVYRQVFEEGSGTEVADDALFEYAALLSDEGRISDAVDTYMRLYREYPRSGLAEESLYRRGELLMRDERYEEAREAYYEHRSRFPGGDLVDVSLYWGAVAARRSGEPYGAALLLERLVEEFPGSALHADALKDLAELYEEVREYERAVRYYTRYRSLYPEEAESFEIGRRVETLKEVMDGKSPREAELSVIVEQEGLDSRRGREAAVELAGIYLGSFTSESDELRDRALSLLRSVVERKDEDAQNAARAQYLLGEYHRREGSHADAARAYAQAAVTARGDEDLSARSMYMAAESALEAGDRAGAARMVSTLESEFPDSEWAAEGRRLIDENR